MLFHYLSRSRYLRETTGFVLATGNGLYSKLHCVLDVPMLGSSLVSVGHTES